jgi:hypothetical protein
MATNHAQLGISLVLFMFVAVSSLSLCTMEVSAQSLPQSVILVRNIRLTDEASGRLVITNVLLVGGRVQRVGADTPAPANATVIDGGGSIYSLREDGSITLKPVSEARLNGNAVYTPAVIAASTPRGNGHPASGNSSTASPQASGDAADEDLAAKVVDPTAAIKTVTFQNKFSPALWEIKDKQNEADVQLGIPLKFLGRSNILRVTIPYLTSSPSGNRGLNDVALFDIMLFPQKWGTPVVGVVANFGVNRGPGIDTFAVGPAVGAVLKKGKWTYGVFNQNLFSAGDVATTQIQPIIAYTVNKKISVAFGDQQFTYDWKQDRFVLLPVGFQVNYIALFGKQPVRFLFGPQYNFQNESGARKWTITTGFALILK